MASGRRHWKEKGGRFYARIAIPVALRGEFGGKTELLEALGSDLRVANRNHAVAVGRLQSQIEADRQTLQSRGAAEGASRDLTQADRENAVWSHFTSVLKAYEHRQTQLPTPAAIAAEEDRFFRALDIGEGDVERLGVASFNLSTDLEVTAQARHWDQNNRTRRLAALRSAFKRGDVHFVEASVRTFAEANRINLNPQSRDWFDLANLLMRAEIAALEQTLARDKGNFGTTPSDPIIRQPTAAPSPSQSIPLLTLFRDYIRSRQAIGKHKDDGANWEHAIEDLARFVGHPDARRITRRALLDWRDALIASGKSAKTVANKYLAAARAVLRWAHDNELLPTNEAESVRQAVPRKVLSRERGYTTDEALRIVQTSLRYRAPETANPANRESIHMTAAKRWVPLLCAFTGARVTEITQLRKEDIRMEAGRWIVRITPDAGSVKTGQYRDVPLHQQVVDLGFIDFVKSSNSGALFHAATTADRYLSHARTTAGRLGKWLHDQKLVPDGVAPNYGWRHRFKTVGRELGVSDRVLDALQGHPGKTASDSYGDVTIAAKCRVIDALPIYLIVGAETVPRP